MSNLIGFFLASSLVVAFQVNASPLVVWCVGTRSWENESLTTQIDVALPAKLDQVLIVRPRNGSRLGVLNGRVGVNRIEITERYGGSEISDRRKFIVAMMPEKHTALVAFLLCAVLLVVASSAYNVRIYGRRKSRLFI
jgi:hypothetical protein